MGLDFHGSKANWSYGGFNRFRTKLAATIGISLEQMVGFKDGDRQGIQPWSEVKDHIVPLLNHSDCEGRLSAKKCKTVGPRLKELVTFWPEDSYDKKQAILLADGMIECARNGKDLVFS